MRNYVQIKTSKRSGTGVLLECDVDIDNLLEEDEKSYIIFTNYHVIQDIKQDSKDKKKNVKLTIIDSKGEKVEQKFIQHIYVESGHNYDNASDVAALLVIIKDCCKITCDNAIFMGKHENQVIETTGYPHVFQTDWINQDLCISGKIEKYTEGGIGLYKIVDDYHSDSNISDKALMEGISGAPLYMKHENKEYLVGINESLCNIGNGKNPFKIVYFLSIDRVLEWLRSQGIILFKYHKKTVKILWIKKVNVSDDITNNSTNNYYIEADNKTATKTNISLLDLEKPKRIVFIGGSGAGKSSFLKSLCQHGDLLGSVGDGQTTRATIVYELSTRNIYPKITITFKKKENFIKDRKTTILYRWYELILCNNYEMVKKDISSNPLTYLQDLVLPLSALLNNELDTIYKEKLKDLLDNINRILYFSDIQEDYDDFYDDIMVVYERTIRFLDDYILKSNSKKNLKYGFFNKKKYEIYRKQNNGASIDNYYKVFDSLIDDKKENQKEVPNTDVKKLITKEEGFFDISEFFFLGEQNEMKEYCDNLFSDCFMNSGCSVLNNNLSEYFNEIENEDDYENKNADEKNVLSEIPKRNFNQRVEAYYSALYQKISDLMRKKGISLTNSLVYNLENVTSEELRIIARCMRKVGKDSLSSIVENIEVEDIIADEYAYEMHINRINSLVCYDTCGFDHIERMSPKIYFNNLFNDIKGKKKNSNGDVYYQRSIDAIIYVKKLDSGKPTELEKMLPIINGMEESAPIFCLFTAIDQYIDGKQILPDSIIWNYEYYTKWKNSNGSREYIFPKIIENMYENSTFVDDIQSPIYIKKKILDFILNHMVPFASKYEVNDDDIIELNINSLLFIMKSIYKDEWNISFIPPTVQEETEVVSRIKEAIKKDLEKMFKLASRTNWEYRHNSTVRANFRRIYRYDEKYDEEHGELGFNRTQIDRWDNLLQAGYSESFLAKDSETIQTLNREWKFSKTKIYKVLSRLKNDIIIEDMGKWEKEKEANNKNKEAIEQEKIEEKNNLRDYLEEMYANGKLFEFNIFERQKSIGDYKEYPKKVELLNKVFNFENVLVNSPKVEIKIVQLIYERIYKALVDNNSNFLDGLYKYDQKFKEGIDYIEKLVNDYSDENFLKHEDNNFNKKLIWEMIMNWNH